MPIYSPPLNQQHLINTTSWRLYIRYYYRPARKFSLATKKGEGNHPLTKSNQKWNYEILTLDGCKDRNLFQIIQYFANRICCHIRSHFNIGIQAAACFPYLVPKDIVNDTCVDIEQESVLAERFAS